MAKRRWHTRKAVIRAEAAVASRGQGNYFGYFSMKAPLCLESSDFTSVCLLYLKLYFDRKRA